MTSQDLILKGTVSSGMGRAQKFLTLEGYVTQFEQLLGYEPFPGTLNVNLDSASANIKNNLSKFNHLKIHKWCKDTIDYGSAKCFPATIVTFSEENYDDAYVISPKRTTHDKTQLELIAPISLRSILSLDDGDELKILVHNL
jgi:riboflavin kinase